MISKKLLSEVLGYIVETVTTIDSVRTNQILIIGEKTKEINIYELAHKCKEWARHLNIQLISGFTETSKQYFCTVVIEDGDVFYSQTEPEAIFQACLWILDNKGL